MKGGQVIGLTSSNDKATVAKQAGADHVFLYESEWVKSIKDVTNGQGVDLVYESVTLCSTEIPMLAQPG